MVVLVTSSAGWGIISAATLKTRPERPSKKQFSKNAAVLVQLTEGRAVTVQESKALLNDPRFAAYKECREGNVANASGKYDCLWQTSSWPFGTDLFLDLTTGKISGTPAHAWSVLSHVTVTRTDDNGTHSQAEADLLIKIFPGDAGKPEILSDHLPIQAVNQHMSEHFTVVGGTPPYSWSLDTTDKAKLPPSDLLPDSNGAVSGTPGTAGSYTYVVKVKDANGQESSSRDVKLVIDEAPDCNNPKYDSNKYFNGIFPLSRGRNINPLGDPRYGSATDYDVQCFWGASGLLAPMTDLQYLYGFGGGANTISADMLSVQMPAPTGIQVSLGTSVTGGGSSSSTVQALQSVEAGGNFYLHAQYPIAVWKNNRFTSATLLDPKLGFSFNGFAGQATVSEATEQYISIPIEGYAEYEGLGNAGGPWVDAKAGFESVPGPFARGIGLTHHNFGLYQVSFGFKFVGLVRVGAQRFWGPSQAFGAGDVNNFNKWHFVIQLSPKSN